MKTFYRVNHEQTKQGLWYKFEGEFSGLIHSEFKFCTNNELRDCKITIVNYKK